MRCDPKMLCSAAADCWRRFGCAVSSLGPCTNAASTTAPTAISRRAGPTNDGRPGSYSDEFGLAHPYPRRGAGTGMPSLASAGPLFSALDGLWLRHVSIALPPLHRDRMRPASSLRDVFPTMIACAALHQVDPAGHGLAPGCIGQRVRHVAQGPAAAAAVAGQIADPVEIAFARLRQIEPAQESLNLGRPPRRQVWAWQRPARSKS